MPNQAMNSGTSARNGMARLICIVESMSSSPRLDSPESTPNARPIRTPKNTPTAARLKEAMEKSTSCPVW